MDEKRIEVEIFGEKIFILSDEDESYLTELSEYVDRKMIEIFKMRKFTSEKPIINSMLLGLNIADELFKERKKSTGNIEPSSDYKKRGETNKEIEDLKNELKRAKSRALRAEDESKKLKYNLDKKTKDFEKLQKEFDEYIETFDNDEKGSKGEIIE